MELVPIRAVIFDLGGTLWEYRPGLTIEEVLTAVAPKAIACLPSAYAPALAPADVATAVRRAYVTLEEAAAHGDTSPMPAELPVIHGLATLGVAVDAVTAQKMLGALHVPERHTTQLLVGAEALLQALTNRKVRLGIISNRMHGGTLLLDDLDYFGISHFFTTVVASCEVGQMKPHPAPYLLALEMLGVGPDQTVMVGDDLRADVGAALSLGMRAVWVRRPPDRPEPTPTGVPAVTRMDQVLPALERLGPLGN